MSSGRAQIGKPAPDFFADAVVDSDFKTVSLADYKGKYVVLFFYPLDLYVPKLLIIHICEWKTIILAHLFAQPK
jgi:hypothetical protein